jgi:hypothetical protein
MFIAQFKPMAMKPSGEDQKEPEQTQTSERSANSEQFLSSPEAKEFIRGWEAKLKQNNITSVTKRGIIDIMGTLHRNSNLTDKQVMREVDRILLGLTGLDGFKGAINKMKAATEGLFKGVRAILGGG